MKQGFCCPYHDSASFSSSRSADSGSIGLSILWDQRYFECPQTGIGLNSCVHSTGSILEFGGAIMPLGWCYSSVTVVLKVRATGALSP